MWEDPNRLVQRPDPQIEEVVEDELRLLKENPLKRTPAPPFEYHNEGLDNQEIRLNL